MQVKQIFQCAIMLIQLCLCQLLAAQGIHGVVYDMHTGQSIPFATIYVDGSFVGISADLNGAFIWPDTQYTNLPLTISAIGYYSKLIVDNEKDSQFFLEPKVYDIPEALIESASLVKLRKKYLKIFRNEFLGTTDNARKCIILNEDDIFFDYSCKDAIKAYVKKPLLIDNVNLGYRLSYYIDIFEYSKKEATTFFKGSLQFNEDVALTNNKRKYHDVREYTYLGSRMHFFQSLWNNDLKKQGFKVLDEEHEAINYKKCIVQDERVNKYFRYGKPIRIEYIDKVSIGVPLKSEIYFDQTGFFDPSSIIWRGAMSEQRIADWLPYEYHLVID